jgi:hypothetical protein
MIVGPLRHLAATSSRYKFHSEQTFDKLSFVRSPARNVMEEASDAVPTGAPCRGRFKLGDACDPRPGAKREGQRRADHPAPRTAHHRGERQARVGLWHPPAKRRLWPHDRSRPALSRSRRKRHWRTEPDPLAWPHAALAPGRRARDFRPGDPCGRQRGLRFPPAVRRHVLDALASGTAGAGADDGAAHYPR